MIIVKIDRQKDSDIALVSIAPFYFTSKKELDNLDYSWEQKLDKMARDRVKCIFVIEKVDNDGISGHVLIRWLRETDCPHVNVICEDESSRETLKLAFENMIIFITWDDVR